MSDLILSLPHYHSHIAIFVVRILNTILGRIVENDPPWDACAGEVTPQDMCECVCALVCITLFSCALARIGLTPDSG